MINESLRKRLEKIHARLTDVEQELSNPEVTKNIKKNKNNQINNNTNHLKKKPSDPQIKRLLLENPIKKQ